ncbi:MAG: EAL domain-containing protein [Ferrimonas sp.]
MSLFRVLWLGLVALVSVLTLASISLSLYANKHFLENQLLAHSQDAATALGLSLAPVLADGDWTRAESMIDTIFDQGEFAQIRLTSIQGNRRIERRRPIPHQHTPTWFQRLLPVASPLMSTEINGYWRLVARLEIASSATQASQILWRLCWQMLLLAVVTTIMAIGLGTLLLNRLLRSLYFAELQAKGLRRQRYLHQPKLPRIRELRSLVEAMNLMVESAEAQFKQQQIRLERMRQQTQIDQETGLGNLHRYRQRLLLAVRDKEYDHGALLKLHLTGLDQVELQQGLGGEQGLLSKIARLLTELALQLPLGRSYRVGFADFILIYPGATKTDLEAIETPVRHRLSALLRQNGGGRVLFAGCDYHQHDHIDALELQLEQALSRILNQNQSHCFEYISNALPSTPLSEQTQLLQSILQHEPKLLAQPVIGPEHAILHHELLSRFFDGQQWHAPITVMAMVMRQQCHKAFDLLVIKAAIKQLPHATTPLSINLTAESVMDLTFARELALLAQSHWPQLLLEIPERALMLNQSLTERFIADLSAQGAHLWLDHTTATGLTLMRQTGLEGIKLAPEYTQALLLDDDGEAILKLMINVAHHCKITVVAQQVSEPEQAERLYQLGVDAVQGFAISAPKPLKPA